MLIFKLASQAFFLENEELLPYGFRSSLTAFSLESFSWETRTAGRGDVVPVSVCAVNGTPPKGKPLCRCSFAEVQATEGGTLFRALSVPECAVLVNGNHWTLFVNGGTDAELSDLFCAAFAAPAAVQRCLIVEGELFLFDSEAYCVLGETFRAAGRMILCAEAGRLYVYGTPWGGKHACGNVLYPLGGISEIAVSEDGGFDLLCEDDASELLRRYSIFPNWFHEASEHAENCLGHIANTVGVFRFFDESTEKAKEMFFGSADHKTCGH